MEIRDISAEEMEFYVKHVELIDLCDEILATFSIDSQRAQPGEVITPEQLSECNHLLSHWRHRLQELSADTFLEED